MHNNPWRSLSKIVQNALSLPLEGIAPWLFKKDKSFQAWFDRYYKRSARHAARIPVKRISVYSEWYFNHALSPSQRNSLLCVRAKMAKEKLWLYMKKLSWIGDTGNVLFQPNNNATAFHRYLLANGYGDWWFASSGSKWDWGVRSRFRGCQLHFRGKSSSSDVEAHIDINNPGDPSSGRVSGPLEEHTGAIIHKLEDDYRRSATHKAYLIQAALLKQGINVNLVR